MPSLFAGAGVAVRFAACAVFYAVIARQSWGWWWWVRLGMGYCSVVHAAITLLVVA
eukprot:COSAG01_NODE_65448_length_273_cov_0.643678_1_plen_55_part_01